MANIPTHKVFVSFHHDDEYYKEVFCRHMGSAIVDKAVDDGDQFGHNRPGFCSAGWTD